MRAEDGRWSVKTEDGAVSTKAHQNVKLLRFGDMLQVQQYSSGGLPTGNTTINTATGTYVDIGMSGEKTGIAGAREDEMRGQNVLVSQAIFSLVSIAAVLLLFRRDLRLLVRYLGKPMRPVKAMLVALGGAVGAKAVPALILIVVSVPFFYFGRTREFKNLVMPENLQHPMDMVSESTFSVVAGIGVMPIAEELIFRGVIFLICFRLFGKIGGVIASTVLFVLIHIGTYSMVPAVILILAVAGVFAALVLLWTKRLRYAMAFHVAFNAMGIAVWSAVTR